VPTTIDIQRKIAERNTVVGRRLLSEQNPGDRGGQARLVIATCISRSECDPEPLALRSDMTGKGAKLPLAQFRLPFAALSKIPIHGAR